MRRWPCHPGATMARPPRPAWWPVCGVCGGPVERFTWTADPATPKTLTLRVDCHGTAETTVWPAQAAGRALGTVAFEAKDDRP